MKFEGKLNVNGGAALIALCGSWALPSMLWVAYIEVCAAGNFEKFAAAKVLSRPISSFSGICPAIFN